jgi:hypothetical protein
MTAKRMTDASPLCLAGSVISPFVAGKIEGDQSSQDDEGSNDEQSSHFSLAPFRRNKPKIMDMAEISSPTPINV